MWTEIKSTVHIVKLSVLRTNSGETFIDQKSWTDSISRHTSFDEDMRGCFLSRSASLYVQLYNFTDLQPHIKFSHKNTETIHSV